LKESRWLALSIPGIKSLDPEKYSSKQTAGPVQHSEELDVVPLGLIGQRWPPSMFMSAQQKRFC
jgi:hypothetical protein